MRIRNIMKFLSSMLFASMTLQGAPMLEPKTDRALGVTGGLLSGYGFGYRTYESSGDAHHLAGILFGDASHFEANAGYEKLNLLRQYESGTLYWIWGTSVSLTTSQGCYDSNPPSYVCNTRSTARISINTGGGLGVEYGFSSTGIRLAIELPLTLSVTMGIQDRSTFGVWPLPSGSLLYAL